MGNGQVSGIRGIRRGGPALVAAALAVTALAGAGQAAAAAHPRSTAGERQAGPAGVISTVAGGVGGPGKATRVAMSPCDVAFGGGHLYIGTGSAVRKVNPGSDRLTTPAGTGVSGPLGNGGRATRATLEECGITVDRSGNLVIADTDNEQVRVVAASTGTFYGRTMTAGDIYSVAGNGQRGHSGNNGPATKAKLNTLEAVAVDAAGNLVIADTDNERIQVVAVSTGTFYGRAMTAGDIYSVAGNGIRGSSGDGGPATSAELYYPSGVVADAAGNLVITDTWNARVRVLAESTGSFYGRAMTAGDIYTVAGNGNSGFSGDGGPATSAELNYPSGVAMDSAGNLVIADSDNERVRVLADSTGSFYGQTMTAGDIYTVAGNGIRGFSGNGGPATGAELGSPGGVAVDGAGNLVMADTGNDRVRVVAESTGRFYGQAMTAGDIYTAAGTSSPVFSGNGGPATSAELSYPDGAVVDAAGDLLIADDDRVQEKAASTGTFYGRAMTAGDIYTVAGNGKSGFSGNGGPATSAKLNQPRGVAVDGAGNLVMADTSNDRVRVVADSTGTFYGQAMTAGDIYTVAGNGQHGLLGDGVPATSAKLNDPAGVAVDGAGNLVVAVTFNERVQVVAASTGTFYGQAMTAGDIYTVAGTGTGGFSGDGGPATSAELGYPAGEAVDGTGNLLIADLSNQRVRVVAASTGTFYGRAMTAGDIYTVAGDGIAGFSGNGSPATSTELNQPQGVAVDGAGDVFIVDYVSNRIREVAG